MEQPVRRSQHNRKKLDYCKLHTGEMSSEEDSRGSKEELDYEDDIVEEEEEGEIVDSDKSDKGFDLDTEIQKALEEEDMDRAEVLLTEKEKRCKSLKAVLKKGEEEAKKRRLKEIQNKFKILQKTEEELNKSIAALRTSTPVNSPKKRENG